MYTLLNTGLTILFILSLIAVIAIPVGGMFYRSMRKIDADYPTLITKEELAQCEHLIDVIPKWIFVSTIIAVLVSILLVIPMTITSRELTKQECLVNDGEWKQWDSGLKWECYNPNLINQGNNFRIVD